MTTADAHLRLYELVLDNGRSASPYVWRIRYALAHKQQKFETVPLGFTDIRKVLGGRFRTVPILEHAEIRMAESWDIAEYLDREFPGTPLFSSPAENAAVRLLDAWILVEVLRRLVGIYVLDIHDAARPEDRAYYRQSREAYFNGKTLEAIAADRESRLPAVRDALAPIRLHLARFPFLGGRTPSYADYIVLGVFQWIASVSTLPLLARGDDVMRCWLERGFDLYGGLGRDPRMRPLFE